ncbi:MAG: MATE family efflux transporter [Bacillota bacterium]
MAKSTRGGMVRGITEGPILPALLTLSWPIIFSNLLQTAYNLADTFWLGRLGDWAVAAVSVSFPIIFLFISVGIGLSIAGTALVAQYIGAGRHEDANYISSQVVGFIAIVALGLSILGYYLSQPILIILGPEPEVVTAASSYLRTWFIGIPFIFGFSVFQSLIKGYGDTVNPMKVMIMAVVLNVILDPLLIFGWGPFPALGVQGAAVATVFARGVAAAIGLVCLFKGILGLKVSLRHIRPKLDTVLTILKVGVPAAAEHSMKALGIMAMTSTVAFFGTPTLAAFGVGNRINSVVFLPSLGLGQATTTIVGQNLGAGMDERADVATRLGSGIAFGMLTAFAVLVFFFSYSVAEIFLPGEGVATQLTSDYLRVIAFSFGFLGILNVANGAFRGAGHTLAAMTFSLLSMLGLRVPLAYILSRFTEMGTAGLWWAVAISNILGGAIALWWFTRGTWKTRIID